MKKVKTKKLIPLLLAVVATFSIFLYAKSISAEPAVNEEASVKLNIEKVDRDTVKISLDDFEPNIKSLQFGLKIDGNAVFKEDGIKSLVTSDDENMKTNVKLSSDKKGVEIFIVSTKPLDRKSTNFEICEVDLEKATDKKTGFSITPYSIDSTGASIAYVLSDTNKRGEEILSTETQTININSAPKIELKADKFVIDGDIILTKGKDFVAEDYVNVTDEDSTFTLTHDGYKVKKNAVGVYNVTYTATDDHGDSTSLQVPVVVEEAVSNPVINIGNDEIVNSTITVNEGDKVDLLKGIIAYDFRGREVAVRIVGDYNLNKEGAYDVVLAAEDIHGNISELPLKIVVGKTVILPDDVPVDTTDKPTTLPDDVPVEDIKPEVPEKPETPQETDKPEATDKPEIQEKPNKPEHSEQTGGSEESSKPQVPEQPETSEKPNEPNTPENTIDKEESVGKGDGNLPNTGQGIYFVITISAAIILIALGALLMLKNGMKINKK